MPREKSGVRSMRKPFAALLLFLVVVVALVLSSVLPDHPGSFGGALSGLAYLVNPFPSRGRKRHARKKGRSAAQRAATRKMLAANKRRHPQHASNPFHGKKHHREKSHRSHAVHMRRNPSSALMRDIAPIGIGATGALATDVLVGFVPWPAQVEASPFAPWIKTAAKAGIAIGAGWGVGKALGKPVGTKFMIGALVVISYGLARDLLLNIAPQLTLGNLPETEYPQIGFAEMYQPGMGESMRQFPSAASLQGFSYDPQEAGEGYAEAGLQEVFEQ